MMLLNIIHKDLKIFCSKLPQNLLALLIFPLIMGLLYGALYDSITSNTIKFNNTNVYYQGTNSDLDEALNKLLTSKGFEFVLLKGPLKGTLDSNSLALEISAKGDIKITNNGQMTIEKEMIINAVNKFAENSNINIEASKYLGEINSKGPAVSVITLQQNKKIPEKLVMVTSCFTLISIFIALVLSSSFFSEKRSNILKRMLSMDMNKKEIFLGNFLSSFVITLLLISSYYIIAYYFIFRVKINLLSLIIVILINSFFISALAAFIIGIFKSEKTVKLIFMPFVMVLMFFGGSLFPVDSYKGAATLAVFTPNYNLMKLYEGVLQGSPIGELTGDIFKILIPALILTIIGAVVFCLREE